MCDVFMIWLSAVIVLWPFLPPWWLLLMISLSLRNVSRCPIIYSSMIFSMVHKLLIGLYDPISYIGLPFLCLGDILSILNVCGNVFFNMICVVKCVKSGAMMSMVFLIMFMEMLLWPVECEFGALMIMLRMSSTDGIGMVNVFVFLVYICLRTSTGLTGMTGISSRIFLMVLM